MVRTSSSLLLALSLLLGAACLPAAAAASEQETRIEALERELAALKAELARLAAERGSATPDKAELERRLEVLAQEVERLKLGEAQAEADQPEHGFAPGASKVYRARRGLSLGGYGELLYQRFDDERDDGTASGRKDRLDLLRGVLYVGYKFNDRFLFNSELEVEHATTGEGDEEKGEVALEFAYVDALLRPEINLRAGLLLVPMGFVNELHEPTVFLGARRPDLERVILPATWRENGLGLFGDLGPFTYRTYLLAGLNAEGFSAGGLRDGRQGGSESIAEDFAWVGRLDYVGTPGLLLGGSVYLGDSGQGLTGEDGRELGIRTLIFEGHAEWRFRGFELRALYAKAELDDVVALNRTLGFSGSDSIGETLQGSYLQAAFDVLAHRGGEAALLPYARFESFDTQDAVPAGFRRDPARKVESLTLGVAYKPIDRLIVKVDFQDLDNDAGTGGDQFNIAFGYVF